MSYDPSHRRQPPRQARWPQATPPEAWRAYREGDAYPGEVQANVDNQGSYWATAAAGARSEPVYQDASVALAADRGYRGYQPPGGPDPFADTGADAGYDGYGGYGVPGTRGDATGGYPALRDGYAGGQNGYAGGQNGYAGGQNGYRDAGGGYANGYGAYGPGVSDYDQRGYGYDDAGADQGGVAVGYEEAQDGFDGAPVGPSRTAVGYAGARDGYPGAPAGYQGRGGFPEPALSGPALAAPDAGIYPESWQAERDRRREAGRRGLAVGALTGFLATAAAIGVSTLTAAFVRPQASPMAALGNVFIDRMPAPLKTMAAGHFGSHHRAVLLLGMYIAIGCLALWIGMLSRRAAALGVAGLAAFSLVGAFAVITRPGGRLSDILPSVVGGLIGVAAILWLMHASAPVTPVRPARGGGRRRTR